MGVGLVRVIPITCLIAGCVSIAGLQAPAGEGPDYPPGAFTHRAGTAQMVLYWNCGRAEPGVLHLEGVLHSPYASEIRNPQFELVGLDLETGSSPRSAAQPETLWSA